MIIFSIIYLVLGLVCTIVSYREGAMRDIGDDMIYDISKVLIAIPITIMLVVFWPFIVAIGVIEAR